MLDLTPTETALDTHHRAFADAALGEGLTARDLAEFDRHAHDEVTLARARRAWSFRALEAWRGMGFAGELLGALTRMGAPLDAIGATTRIARDATAHSELCRRMVLALGGKPSVPGAPGVSGLDPRLPPRLAVARAVFEILAVERSLDAELLTALGLNATDRTSREAFARLAEDTRAHARIGWDLLAWLLPRLSEGERADFDRVLPRLVSAAIRRRLAVRREPTAEPPLGAERTVFGAVSHVERTRRVKRVVDEVIDPRVAHLWQGLQADETLAPPQRLAR